MARTRKGKGSESARKRSRSRRTAQRGRAGRRADRRAPNGGHRSAAATVPGDWEDRSYSDEWSRLQEAVAGRYVIEQEIGKGAMGIVYLATDVALDRPVAIKLLRPEFAERSVSRQRFLLEARTAAKLSHPNIVPIHLVEDRDDVVFFVMQYLDGETLGATVERAGPLDTDEAVKLMQEVAWALGHAHAHGVVHRDVKPDNIVIDRATGRAIVTDFGIAHQTDAARMTGVGEVVGTAYYMSPEQAAGDTVDARSDIYSLGATMYYALAGSVPFEAPTIPQILAMQHTTDPPPLTSVRPSVPRHLADIVKRCMAKTPDERFPSADILAARLGDARSSRLEMAPEIRTFLRTAHAAGHRLGTLVPVSGIVVYALATIERMGITDPFLVLWLSWVVLVEVLGQPFALLRSARHMLRAGIGYPEFVKVVQATHYQQFLESPSHELRRRVVTGTIALVVAAVALTVAALVETGPAVTTIGLRSLGVAGILFAVGFLGAAFLSAWGAAGGGAWLRQTLWAGRFGRWFFRLAGTGLRRLPEGRPQETVAQAVLQRGVARLIGELPRPVREHIKDAWDVVRQLEARTPELLERRATLEQALRGIRAVPGPENTSPEDHSGDDGSPRHAVEQRRGRAEAEIKEAMASTDQRLSDIAAHLDMIRVEVHRVRAGVGTADHLMATLEAARSALD